MATVRAFYAGVICTVREEKREPLCLLHSLGCGNDEEIVNYTGALFRMYLAGVC